MAEDAGAALALSTIALVPSIFGAALPPLAVVHDQSDATGGATRSLWTATATAAVVVVGVAALTRSPSVLLAGGATTLAFCALYRQAIQA